MSAVSSLSKRVAKTVKEKWLQAEEEWLQAKEEGLQAKEEKASR